MKDKNNEGLKCLDELMISKHRLPRNILEVAHDVQLEILKHKYSFLDQDIVCRLVNTIIPPTERLLMVHLYQISGNELIAHSTITPNEYVDFSIIEGEADVIPIFISENNLEKKGIFRIIPRSKQVVIEQYIKDYRLNKSLIILYEFKDGHYTVKTRKNIL